LILTELWHGSADDISLRLAMPSGFSFVDYVRPHDPFMVVWLFILDPFLNVFVLIYLC